MRVNYHAPPVASPPYHCLPSDCNIFNARSAMSFLKAFSASGPSSALPIGLTILTPVTILVEPTISATGTIVQTWAVGIPILSISLLSADPQRVLVPQVDVRITPSTPAAFSADPISLPILRAFSTVVATPVVAKK